ncbi:MAG: MiaB/RimO family radical SAM methylthiotransferase [Paludibacteraceae bacterium]|nr:MiaB/RimO family radical SAM methylthiotransferase [Paludibacteraceae bacterium]
MRIRIVTLGCKLNFAESSALMRSLEAAGHVRAKAGEAADVVIVNTCTVTDAADHKDRQAIHRLRRENPGAKMIVTGCYAALLKQRKDAEILKEIDHLVVKNTEKFQPAWSKDDRTRCFLKVQDGCNYFCTYCTIPYARGRSRNISIDEVVAQAKEALASGAKEIVLTGVNIGDFGRSTNEKFIDLLRALDEMDISDYRIRISSCEPNLLTDEIIEFVARSKHFAPHFHIPLQSGSNEVLKIMHRRYTRELFAERVAHIKQVMPNAFIGVDCMVGVRGETAECFEDYVTFVKSLPVSQLHVFTYSERANTKMLEMDLYVVPKAERERRSKVMHTISNDKLAAFYAEHQGEEATVLWESKRLEGGLMSGWTENYIKVTAPFDRAKVNTFERIKIGAGVGLP